MSDDKVILSFHGSRILDNPTVEKKIKNEIEKYNPEYVVTHGEASGVCDMVRTYCRRNGIPLKLHFLQTDKYAQGAFHHRSLAVIKESTHCVFIHDGKSKGTQNELELAKKLKKPYEYYLVEDEGIEDINDVLKMDEL